MARKFTKYPSNYVKASRQGNITLKCVYMPRHTFNPNARPKTIRVSKPDLISALMLLCDCLTVNCSSNDIQDMIENENATVADIIDYIADGNGDNDYDEIYSLVNTKTGEEYISSEYQA